MVTATHLKLIEFSFKIRAEILDLRIFDPAVVITINSEVAE